jgi:single-stranded DNA-binding protein
MYVVPTQPIQAVPTGTAINQVYLAGGVGFIGEQYREDAFNFGLMCQAPPQKTLGHTWQDSLGFRIESWRDDAERMKKFLFVGRQVAMGGTLKFECWTGKDNVTRHNYKIRVRASQYSFFGKNKKTEELEKKADEALKEIKLENPQFSDSPHQQAISKSTSKPKKAKEVDDGIPF